MIILLILVPLAVAMALPAMIRRAQFQGRQEAARLRLR
jgi:hypothetical protein